MTQPILRLQGVRRSFGAEVAVEVLKGIDLEIRQGELVALIGPSGSGKSTLLNQIGLLDRPSAGRLYVDGTDTIGLDDGAITELRGRFLGFVFQFHHLLPALTVLENIMLPKAAQAGGFRSEMTVRAREILSRVGLSECADKWPKQLSGGMQQRVAVARALMNAPALVLADEPTGNLDTESSDRVFELLVEINELHDTAFLIVTHDRALARRCERVIRIVDGRIVGDGLPQDVLGPE
ncbi:MAG: ABC transporter ATP-binding protein [Myxococcales bacterium]|nr:ABC transporter ATP-binding protein [Myxococcales bacterium]